MKEYDVIAIGTGSAMNIISSLTSPHNHEQQLKIAVIDKDDPGGICLTKGCIPTKILLYPSEVIRTIQRASLFGIDVDIKKIDFKFVMERMRSIINSDIESIRAGLSQAQELDYYPETAEFIDDYTLKVGKDTIKGKTILLCTGSKPKIPDIKGLEDVSYHTSDSILQISKLPETITIVGGGYIAAEYGHFFSTMGSKVTIIGRNSQFLPQEEPEISALAKRDLQKHMEIYTDFEVIEVGKDGKKKKTIATNRTTNEKITIESDEIFIATGRSSNSDILHPEKSGIKTDSKGWILVNEYMETSKLGIWAFGDANGKFLFKHAANYESQVAFYNAFQKQEMIAEYHAIPHAVFTDPEVAGVGLGEKQAIEQFGEDEILIGFHRYQDTAKGHAMELEDYFVKIIVNRETSEILGAHIIGPFASVLIQEVINLMYTPDRSVIPLMRGMHIHPALNEVVERAAGRLIPVNQYHEFLKHLGYAEK
ncbi:MAG: dihydrolipoyl dehydrogenase [Asgard group archaeon]|nr:dihydrolipoyl dehydrogenase [Asgard group archaeon]